MSASRRHAFLNDGRGRVRISPHVRIPGSSPLPIWFWQEREEKPKKMLGALLFEKRPPNVFKNEHK